MINLKELIKLRTMKYSESPKKKHEKRMQMETPHFMGVMIPHTPPHENDSRQTLNELKYLQTIETDSDFIKEHDDVPKVFKQLLEHHDSLTTKASKVMDTLVDESRKFIYKLKYHYNRPRPYQVAQFYGMDLNGVELNSMKTPSYPSGHATQGYLVAEVLKGMLPHLGMELDALAEDIAFSRIVAKAHYPSDKDFGKKVARIIYQSFGKSLKEDINIPVNVGDTILTGRFKNKKVKVKSIGKDEHGMPTVNGKKVVTFRMPKLKELVERIDYLDTAQQIVKQQGLKSRVKFGKGPNKADYDWKKDIIYLRPNYATMKDFLITIYHEIDHAKDRKKFGAKTYEKKYQRAGDIAVNQGKDFHDDNYYEEKAERYGKKMAALHMRKIK
jgi:hypothetical protein